MDIAGTAAEVLEAVAEAFAPDVPARQYTTVGEVPWDCAQLTVSFERARLGLPQQDPSSRGPCPPGATAVFTVELLRPCAPDGKDEEALVAYGAARLADVQVMTGVLRDLTARSGGASGTVDVRGPQGQFVAIRMEVTLAVRSGP